MRAEVIGIIGIVVLIILLFMRVWVGSAMALVGFCGLLIMRGFTQTISVLGTVPFNELNNQTMTAIPMFTLMGMIIAETSMGRDLYGTAYNFLGHARGGLASATVVAGGILGAICGSENVSTVILTKIAYPEMKRLGYDDALSTSAISVGSPLAIIIPPSMPMILYAILTENSVGSLFMGGVIPGILLILAFVLTISIMCRIKPEYGPRGPKTTMVQKLKSLKGVIPVIVLFVIVLGGIYFGICTTTEAGALGALGALIIALCSKQINRHNIKLILRETVSTIGMVIMMMVGIYVFVQFIALSKVPFMLVNFVTGLNVNRYVILLAIVIMYIILGMLLPQLTIIILTVPIIFPVIESLGFNAIWFGIVVVMLQALGGIPPPVGMVAFMTSGISKVPVPTVFKGLWPMLLADVIVLLLVCFIPQLVTWLPSMMR